MTAKTKLDGIIRVLVRKAILSIGETYLNGNSKEDGAPGEDENYVYAIAV